MFYVETFRVVSRPEKWVQSEICPLPTNDMAV